MRLHWSDVVYFFVGIFLPTYEILNRINRLFGPALKRLFVRTERDAIVWLHYKKRAMNQRHAPKHPRNCIDEDCAQFS